MSDSTNEKKSISIEKKIKISFYSAMIFFFISSPFLYQFVQKTFGEYVTVADQTGCPTNQGLLLHTAVFFTIIFLSMLLS
jgi:hypothetical protein